MRAVLALTALLPALALSAPAEMGLPMAPVTCTTPVSDWLPFFPSIIPDVGHCTEALRELEQGENYRKGSKVEFGTCRITYNSDRDIEGKELEEAAKAAVVAVLGACKSHQGTYVENGSEIRVKKSEIKKHHRD